MCPLFLPFYRRVFYAPSYVEWLTGIPVWLRTLLISMVPFIELRGSIPAASYWKADLWTTFLWAVLGNMIPIPFILLLLGPISDHQVSGRAGRGDLPGRVIVQTYCPEHYAIRAAFRGDPDDFYQRELEYRREASYPPFCRLVNLVVSAPAEEHARAAAEALGADLRSRMAGGPSVVLGPAPAPLSRLKGRYRFHLTLKVLEQGRVEEGLRASIRSFDRWRSSFCRGEGIPPEDVSLTVDVDPVTML